MAIGYEPPHEVRDTAKLAAMIATLEAGGELPAILVTGETALCGSHRLAAWEACELPAQVVELDDDDYCAAMEHLGLDPVYDDTPADLDDFFAALIETGADVGEAKK